jgi:hypothetical protein
MKKLLILLFSFILGSAMAQTQIPEGGFNNWTPSTLSTYYEPTGGWWTTLNTLTSLGAPATVSRSTDVHSGTYAAKLETKQWGTFLLAGLLASGNFITISPFIELGKPFVDKPIRFKGWYKFASVNGDSSGVVAILTRFNSGTGKKDTIAIANQTFLNSVSVYTQFDLNFNYKISGMNPDSITMVFTSSADGGNFNGQAGSTLFIDDVSLEYSNGLAEILMPEFIVNAYPIPANELLSLEFITADPEKLICHIYSIDGRLMTSFSPNSKKHQLDVSTWQQGSYILQACIGNSIVSSAKFIIKH